VIAPRRVRRFGDGALVADTDSVGEAHGLASALRRRTPRDGVEDVVVGYRSVVVVADPAVAELAAIADELARMPADLGDPTSTRRVDIPVAFDGPDLGDVAARAALTPTAVIEQLLGCDLSVAFVGFLPGFAYLDGLPPALAAVSRRSSPRTTVAAGSLAIGGGFAGIYPRVSPGGWHLLGHTGFPLFDPDTPPFATLKPGDRVRLLVVEDPGWATTTPRPPLRSDAANTVEVGAPGLLSMVQDLGRIGVAALGVPRGGAADPFALRAANRLVGNDGGAAAIEVTARGPRLRFAGPAHVAVVGRGEVQVDGGPVAVDTVVPVAAGQEVSIGATFDDLRCYVAVAGGIEVDPVLGSRSSDVLSGLGPGALRAGDVLGIGPPRRPRGRLVRGDVGTHPDGAHRGTQRGGAVLRVIPGPDGLGTDAVRRLVAGAWEVGGASDRMGVRLFGDEPLETAAPGIASRGMVTGAVQVPPDGRPVVLLCDHATVGGYPVAATVVRADVGVLGQLRPGDAVRFEAVDLAHADRARAHAERALRQSVVGWFPVRSD
jgi:KipI family sensor histidine kinase inhibitor